MSIIIITIPEKLSTSLLHLLQLCASAWVSANGFPVYSSTMSVHRFLCLPLFLFPSIIPSLENGLCEATGSCDVAEPFGFLVLHWCEEVFMRADVVFDRTAHLFICDIILVWDAQDLTVTNKLLFFFFFFSFFFIATVVRLAITVWFIFILFYFF